MPSLPFDQVVSPTLLRRFLLEAHVEDASEDLPEFKPGEDIPPAPFYGIVLRDDGHLAAHHPWGPPLDDMQILFAGDVLKKINKELHHDGAWVMVFTNPRPKLAIERTAEYRRYALIWLDKDADPQFTIEWHEGISSDFREFADVMIAGIHALMQRAEGAWSMWAENRRMLDLKAGHTFKKAKGERAPSAA